MVIHPISLVQKYDIIHDRDNIRKMDFVVNADEFAVNASYILVTLNSNLYDLFLHYADEI